MRLFNSLFLFFTARKKKMEKLKLLKTHGKEEWLRWVIGGSLVILLVLMFPRGKSLQFADMKEGSISTRRIVAPFDFEILKTKEEYQRDREIAAEKVYPIFFRDNSQTGKLIHNLNLFFEKVKKLRKMVLRAPRLKTVLKDSLLQQYPISVVNSLYLEQLIDPGGKVQSKKLKEFQNNIEHIIRDLLAVGVMDANKDQLMNPDRRLIVTEENEEIIHPFSDFYSLKEARGKTVELLNKYYPHDVYFAQVGFGIINFFLRPNLIYDKKTHHQRIEEAKARVPLASGFVKENELIVDKNERITPEIRKKLVSLATKMAEKGMQEGGIKRLFPLIGKFAFVVALLFLLTVFIIIDRPKMLKEIKSILLLSLIILLISIFTFLIHRLDASEYLVPSVLGAVLLATVFDERFGYVGTAILSVLVGALWGNEFNLMAVSFFVGVVGVITIRRVRNRSQLIQAILYLVGAYVFAITFMGFLRFLPFREIVKQWSYGALNGLFTPIVAYGILPLIESVFDITTDFSLLELSNLNHPLLKRLSVEAPGTYHHSIIVGNLSEAAAQAIGANSLLARVGSYYHDVGKMEKAEYFVENQMDGKNPHEKLTPRMSALILMNHVKRGAELADKYKLPSPIKDIILQHHGTTVMSFFYHKAVEKNGTENISEENYRYPGPKPQSKEAAIVMLADAVEAAARSLKEPTHSRLKGLIEELVDERFQKGELDESPLTLRDLERIKESFLQILAGIFHARVEYPEREEQKSVAKQMDQKNGLSSD